MQDLTTVQLSLLIAFGVMVFVQLLYYWLLFARLAFYKPKILSGDQTPPVSIVISARNEYHHLVKFLPAILHQDYHTFEVVVVNHTSDDETKEYLTELQRTEPRLKIVNIERELNFFSGKKFPLSLGIKSARNEIVLLTDADCEPISDQWISTMVRNYLPDTEIVLGYGPYKSYKSFLNLIVRYDTFMVGMQYLSYALAGLPYMGVGRNLSYSRSMFFRNKGFTSHYKIQSGDDDLFINQVATRKNTRIEVDEKSFTYSEPKKSFSSWYRQKKRHLGTGRYYKFKFKLLLGLYSISQFLFFLLFVLCLVFDVMTLWVAGAFALRFFTQILVHKYTLTKLREPHLLLFSLIWEVFHMLIIQTISVIGIFRKKVQWK